jgi:hypothetical protein
MPKKPLPHFSAVDIKEMRRFWKQYNRNVIHELEDYFQSIHKMWRDEGLGQLVALEKTRLIFVMERSRFGNLQGLYVPTNRRGEDDPEAMAEVV